MNIKLSPFMIFLLLLIVLVISITFGNMLNLEGFITFGYSNNTMDDMQIPQYSSAYVNKLYDNIFYDPKNGNLIEVDGVTYGNTISGNTVSSLYVTPRTNPNQTFQYNVSGVTTSTVDLSTTTSTASSFSSFMYPTQSANTDKYSVFYIPFGSDTLVHIIDNTTKINVGSFGYINGSMSQNILSSTSTIGLGTYLSDTDTNNDKMIEETYYDTNNKVYQISKYVRYDISNARLIVKNSATSNDLTIYDRFGTSMNVSSSGYNNAQNGVSSVSLHSWVATDSLANQMILYLGFGTKTVIALIKYTNQFELVNIRRFDGNGVYNSNGSLLSTSALLSGNTLSNFTSNTSSTSSTSTSTSATTNTKLDVSGNDLSDFFKLYSYWKSNPNTEFSQDYILKSSIVPPVCPSCPSCPSASNQNTVCTNCGGQGGSGTLSSNGNTTIKLDTRTNIPGAVASLGGTVGDVANKALDTTGDVVDEAGNLVKGAVTGTVGLAKGAVTGTVGLAKEAVSGTVGLAKEAVSGTVGLLKDAGSGVKDVLTSHPAKINSGASTTATGTTTADNQTQPYGGKAYGSSSYGGSGATNYNYYGALPSKSSNFIPVTADFSAFGK
uniref:Uncharacterized protein n=1 Tax=viral metagenome TaxID=1070528 RepID=A0A6C0HD14_9ZZZZ